jgi:heat shock protein HslJ
MPRRLICTGLAALCLVVAACGSESDGDAGSDTTTTSESTTTVAAASGELDGRSYESVSITGRELVEGSTVVLSFEDGDVSVVAGCNTTSGAYSFEDGTLTLEGDARSTMMGCDDALSEQDAWLTEWLSAGVTVTETDDGMTLEGDGVTIELVAGGDELAAPLVGAVWTLETISTDGTASNVPASVQAPTLEFLANGDVNATTGCNTGGTSVTTGEGTMTFGPMRLTMMACEGDAGSVEAAVTTTLDGEVTYTIEGNQLTLTKGDTSLVYAGA